MNGKALYLIFNESIAVLK